MKALFLALIATLTIGVGTARAQETKAHEHEHAQPPAVPEQKADGQTERKEMCACCQKDGTAAMKDAMKDKMKDMMEKKS